MSDEQWTQICEVGTQVLVIFVPDHMQGKFSSIRFSPYSPPSARTHTQTHMHTSSRRRRGWKRRSSGTSGAHKTFSFVDSDLKHTTTWRRTVTTLGAQVRWSDPSRQRGHRCTRALHHRQQCRAPRKFEMAPSVRPSVHTSMHAAHTALQSTNRYPGSTGTGPSATVNPRSLVVWLFGSLVGWRSAHLSLTPRCASCVHAGSNVWNGAPNHVIVPNTRVRAVALSRIQACGACTRCRPGPTQPTDAGV